MSVREFWEDYVRTAEEKLTNAVDEALDAIALAHKGEREELRELAHRRAADAAARHKAAATRLFDVVLTVEGTVEEARGLVGTAVRLSPRPSAGGACRLGRSTGATFAPPSGFSLSFDSGVSVWHGKLTAVGGQVFYTDLRTRNGTHHNGARMPQDAPVPLATGDTLALGDTTLRVRLEAVAPGGEENAAPAAAAAAHAGGAAAGAR